MPRRAAAVFFLLLLVVGVVGLAAAGVVRCGDCCHTTRSKTCDDVPATGFSLCCFHSSATLPRVCLPVVVLAERPIGPSADETGDPPPDPRGVLHVPKTLLT